MEVTTLCAVVASLRVVPNRSQFFQYESVSLSCEHQGNSSGWRLRRNTSTNTHQVCPTHESSCSISDLYTSDSGVYWCESAAGDRSESVGINVTAGSVVLDCPGLPLTEGQAVTLRCRSRLNSSSADFYKDGRLIGSSSTGNLSLGSVSRADEGVYKCSSGAGESPSSRLTVLARPPPPPPPPPLTYLVLPVVGVCLLLVSALLCRWRRHKENDEQDISYTDVTVTPDVQLHRMRGEALDAGETFYSTLNLSSI